MGNFKRIIISLLSIILCISVLGGCGTTNNNTLSGNNDTQLNDNVDDTIDDLNDSDNIDHSTDQTTDDSDISKNNGIIDLNLTDKQKNSINMLNYITVLIQEINVASNNKLYLEEVYEMLNNDINPESVDDDTKEVFLHILDELEDCRMINEKRERIEYLYDLKKANNVYNAVPNPLSILSAVRSTNAINSLTSFAYVFIDSYSNYHSNKNDMDMEFLKDNWELDDELSSNLHDMKRELFSYKVDMVNEYNLPGDYTLNKKLIEDFAKWNMNENNTAKLNFYISNQEKYKAYGRYWLKLAEAYFNDNDYQKCLESIDIYDNLDVSIFREDKEYAKSLVFAIISANKSLTENEYIKKAREYGQLIIDNTDTKEDWSLRYFVSGVYADLYDITGDIYYLNKAYEWTLNLVNDLIEEQKSLNSTYLSKIKTIEIDKKASKEERKQIKEYNKLLKETRKTELPPIYSPLVLNCNLLFSLIEKLDINANQKEDINEILHYENQDLFLIEQLDNLYRFNNNKTKIDTTFEFKGDSILIPAKYLSDCHKIKVSVNSKKIDGWTLNKVERKKESDLNTFIAEYKSKSAKKFKYKKGDIIKINISSTLDEKDKLTIKYKVKQKEGIIKSIYFERVK